tara:strand:- start:107 stop:274 length:168 start_codon:yes stop_codon:yes gene_type:complete
MPVIEEDGGRLNAFAKEPRMEITETKTLNSSSSRLIVLAGALLVIGLIAFTITIS